MEGLPLERHPNLLVGFESASDAGIYKLSDEVALVQSLDFFTPIVDDPYEFGQIAAANSMSDLYAMGARPVTALNIVCFPSKDLPKAMLGEILRGGIDKVHEAGAVVVGGHSVEDREPKYGLSVTGVVHPARYLTNAGARPGDRLVLTKPLGTGVLATALKAGLLQKPVIERMTAVMRQLNRAACEAMLETGVNACTDISGFGLGGHALEMADASGVQLVVEAHRVPLIQEALEFLNQGFIPEGDYEIRSFCTRKVAVEEGVPPGLRDMIFDAQTSGGLLISVPEDRCDALFDRLLQKGLVEIGVIGWAEEDRGIRRLRILP